MFEFSATERTGELGFFTALVLNMAYEVAPILVGPPAVGTPEELLFVG